MIMLNFTCVGKIFERSVWRELAGGGDAGWRAWRWAGGGWRVGWLARLAVGWLARLAVGWRQAGRRAAVTSL